MAESLAKSSPYEQLFRTRHRGAGRPSGDVAPVFAEMASARGSGVSPVILAVAKRRAYAVLHEEGRERLQELFSAELKVLKRRGEEEVARDAGVALKEDGSGTPARAESDVEG